jgi:hypothetical protein
MLSVSTNHVLYHNSEPTHKRFRKWTYLYRVQGALSLLSSLLSHLLNAGDTKSLSHAQMGPDLSLETICIVQNQDVWLPLNFPERVLYTPKVFIASGDFPGVKEEGVMSPTVLHVPLDMSVPPTEDVLPQPVQGQPLSSALPSLEQTSAFSHLAQASTISVLQANAPVQLSTC